MVIFKLVDTEGFAVSDFDLILTAGDDNDPNHLPEGFFADRQRNHISPATITYYFNYDVMAGAPQIVDKDEDGKVVRDKLNGVDSLGLIINPRPDAGFVKYLPCEIKATKELFEAALKPNSTTLIEICLQRLVNKEIFNLEKFEGDTPPKKDFSKTRPGDWILE